MNRDPKSGPIVASAVGVGFLMYALTGLWGWLWPEKTADIIALIAPNPFASLLCLCFSPFFLWMAARLHREMRQETQTPVRNS